MINKINTINTTLYPGNEIKKINTKNEFPDFKSILKNTIDNVSDLQIYSERIANDFALGKTDNIHEVLLASEKADIALQFTMQIRNKILDAYNEIMRMQI